MVQKRFKSNIFKQEKLLSERATQQYILIIHFWTLGTAVVKNWELRNLCATVICVSLIGLGTLSVLIH